MTDQPAPQQRVPSTECHHNQPAPGRSGHKPGLEPLAESRRARPAGRPGRAPSVALHRPVPSRGGQPAEPGPAPRATTISRGTSTESTRSTAAHARDKDPGHPARLPQRPAGHQPSQQREAPSTQQLSPAARPTRARPNRAPRATRSPAAPAPRAAHDQPSQHRAQARAPAPSPAHRPARSPAEHGQPGKCLQLSSPSNLMNDRHPDEPRHSAGLV